MGLQIFYLLTAFNVLPGSGSYIVNLVMLFLSVCQPRLLSDYLRLTNRLACKEYVSCHHYYHRMHTDGPRGIQHPSRHGSSSHHHPLLNLWGPYHRHQLTLEDDFGRRKSISRDSRRQLKAIVNCCGTILTFQLCIHSLIPHTNAHEIEAH